MSRDPFSIVALAGDGIGPEVMREAVLVLRAVERLFDLPLRITEAPVGWAAIDSVGGRCPTTCSRCAGRATPSCSDPSAFPIATTP